MTKRLWNEASIAEFRALIAAGRPRDEIAEKLGRTVAQVTNLYYSLRTKHNIEGELVPSGNPLHASPLRGWEKRIIAMSGEGLSSGQIAERLGLMPSLVASYMSRNGLYAPERRNGQRPPQTLKLAVNLPRPKLPDVDEDDVRLARQAWREFEGAA